MSTLLQEIEAQITGINSRATKRNIGTIREIRDGVGTTFGRWGVTGVPETFFIDRRGRVVPPHITGPASKQDIDEGIRLALKS